jgi:predicted 3-demethylubiquinone-9 3-methyltransferase (glyoxalase superfamily)
MQKITTCLWFDTQGLKAANWYISIFKGKILKILYYGNEGFEIHGKHAGEVMLVEFEMLGQTFQALNGGPEFTFSEAISISVSCETQEEVDFYWNKLKEDGVEGSCGWLKDKYGLSWQIVPAIMRKFLENSESPEYQRVMKAMLQMKKLDIAALKQAYEE